MDEPQPSPSNSSGGANTPTQQQQGKRVATRIQARRHEDNPLTENYSDIASKELPPVDW
ncbi:hypothetical protein PIB30_030666 [Stylosanthes scabra]|uniref:Uncharacterized protein n=1 Tax=Stylosanthes scabra TaxID=79078 RepID=A0ABU6QBJ0_9FABA|nr:hypothetical protein [Stylosanthes scabra]